jgi:hypothetical protein
MSEEKKEVQPQKEVQVEEKPSLTDLAEAGFADKEMKAAEKYGLVKKEDNSEEEVKEEKTAAEIAKDPDVQEAFTDPKKETELLKNYNQNETGLYFKMKKERQKRKTAESEKEHLDLKLKLAQKEGDKLKKKIERLKKKADKKPSSELEDLLQEEDVKSKREEVEEEEEELENEEEKSEQEGEEKEKRAKILKSKLAEQEIDAKTRYKDFDSAVELASDILKNPDKFYEDEPRLKSKLKQKAMQLIRATQMADQFQDGEYGPADMAYELGQLHPDYEKSDAGGKKEESSKKDEGLTPEKLKKITDNSKKRSIGSVGGGSSRERADAYADLTAEDLASMSQAEFAKVPKETRSRILAAL